LSRERATWSSQAHQIHTLDYQGLQFTATILSLSTNKTTSRSCYQALSWPGRLLGHVCQRSMYAKPFLSFSAQDEAGPRADAVFILQSSMQHRATWISALAGLHSQAAYPNQSQHSARAVCIGSVVPVCPVLPLTNPFTTGAGP